MKWTQVTVDTYNHLAEGGRDWLMANRVEMHEALETAIYHEYASVYLVFLPNSPMQLW